MEQADQDLYCVSIYMPFDQMLSIQSLQVIYYISIYCSACWHSGPVIRVDLCMDKFEILSINLSSCLWRIVKFVLARLS